jgi:ribosomal protein S27AE
MVASGYLATGNSSDQKRKKEEEGRLIVLGSKKLDAEAFDLFNRIRITTAIEEAVAAKQKLCPVVCGFTDSIGDSERATCSQCGNKVVIRPWLLELVKKYNLQILCLNCINPLDLLFQLEEDVQQITQLQENPMPL